MDLADKHGIPLYEIWQDEISDKSYKQTVVDILHRHKIPMN